MFLRSLVVLMSCFSAVFAAEQPNPETSDYAPYLQYLANENNNQPASSAPPVEGEQQAGPQNLYPNLNQEQSTQAASGQTATNSTSTASNAQDEQAAGGDKKKQKPKEPDLIDELLKTKIVQKMLGRIAGEIINYELFVHPKTSLVTWTGMALAGWYYQDKLQPLTPKKYLGLGVAFVSAPLVVHYVYTKVSNWFKPQKKEEAVSNAAKVTITITKSA